ncbi:MAG: MoaD/ThiS family protein [Candidatus Thorarchaeota archaeon]|nr:MoaD/ThiS family protein [Candidatus Thorarchaeota archaeon]
MTTPIEKARIQEIVLTETKTVAQLLLELNLSDTHVVLVDGERQNLDTVLQENDSVVVLPLIAGG